MARLLRAGHQSRLASRGGNLMCPATRFYSQFQYHKSNKSSKFSRKDGIVMQKYRYYCCLNQYMTLSDSGGTRVNKLYDIINEFSLIYLRKLHYSYGSQRGLHLPGALANFTSSQPNIEVNV